MKKPLWQAFGLIGILAMAVLLSILPSPISDSECIVTGDCPAPILRYIRGEDNIGLILVNTGDLYNFRIHNFYDDGTLNIEDSGKYVMLGSFKSETRGGSSTTFRISPNAGASLLIENGETLAHADYNSARRYLCVNCAESVCDAKNNSDVALIDFATGLLYPVKLSGNSFLIRNYKITATPRVEQNAIYVICEILL